GTGTSVSRSPRARTPRRSSSSPASTRSSPTTSKTCSRWPRCSAAPRVGSRSARASTTPAPHEATLTSYDAVLGTVWRDEWGRLLALLVAQYRRLDLAEDGLGDAFESAARAWPRDGVPTSPAAWLLTAARRRVIDPLRTQAVAARTLPALAVEADLQERAERTMADVGEVLVDERLRLVLLC